MIKAHQFYLIKILFVEVYYFYIEQSTWSLINNFTNSSKRQ
jgi:hypothetical protein